MATTYQNMYPKAGSGICGLIGTTASVTSNTTSDEVEITGFRYVTVKVANGAANGVTYTLQGSVDGTGWETIAYGAGSSAAYTQAARTTSAGDTEYLYLPPADFIRYVRANVSSANANGTTFTVYAQAAR